jgi:hypothetical protein
MGKQTDKHREEDKQRVRKTLYKYSGRQREMKRQRNRQRACTLKLVTAIILGVSQ